MLKILVLGFERCASVCLGSARYVLKCLLSYSDTMEATSESVYVPPGESQHRVVELRGTLN